MSARPSGQVAFLFTDLEGSTRYWEQRPADMPAVYARHDAILRAAATAHGGSVYKVVGDAFQIAFPSAAGAVRAAVESQLALLAEPWPISPAPRVRMALHVCEVVPDADGDYRTPGLNRLGRLLSAADGGQILCTEALAGALAGHPPSPVRLDDLGEHRFRDLSPQRVFQVHAPGLPAEPARLRGMAEHRHNLPPRTTVFVGREEETRQLQRLLTDPAVRLLTLLGPGGIGKTRLAIETAATLIDAFGDGVWFAPLAELRDPDLIAPAIAGALGVRTSVDQSPLEAVVAHLAEREALLVLDNLEQLPGAAVPLAALRAGCPRLTLLATSRTPLGLSGERVFPLPPLAVASAVANDDDLAASDAIRLFADRARLVRPAFTLDAETIAAVAAICARLDGLPLAIELAAARTRLLTPAQMLPRLASRLAFLTGGPGDAPARQQTLRAAIDWSYDLLDSPAQTLLVRLGVFRGGATLEGVEAVCADPEAGELFAVVEELVRQSLVAVDESSPTPRVRLLETIGDYARERLAQRGEDAALATRHAAYFLDLAERAQGPLVGAEERRRRSSSRARSGASGGSGATSAKAASGCGACWRVPIARAFRPRCAPARWTAPARWPRRKGMFPPPWSSTRKRSRCGTRPATASGRPARWRTWD
jgi:predicted ATPase/class 3 adenylate cyclase